MAAASKSKYFELVSGFYKSYAAMQNFQRTAAKCRVVDVAEGRVKVEMDVQEEHTNTFGTLHGGLTATLVDIVTTTALCATRRGSAGVSVDLTVNYLAPAKIGDTILIDAFVNRRGQTMGFTGADIFRKSDGLKIATALHTKAFPREVSEGQEK
ncbi:hypothetical protein niasHS_011243 [Heterodera schachtii]|uniref:Acyl-coenzyme A thioesterase 13 n=1 Tax=Heterodera schachtii TaxID=97005 RepID=A0ABD2J106_HETSC